ncbi:Cytochrome P450 [Amycolatopsis arida]|uniref:Cytochrome P450 n=1 Tax=Amycolatopsis arida TaxID=587909 RepID=A0A1I5P286_9PSEU|nr:cytochrome P450 [Amycolatopsis arida]TDX98328.1 cytochrome P450 [Amycolatopsis arida]SFP28132.1 Cytochrome P450 [Amycolatopsis arida]
MPDQNAATTTVAARLDPQSPGFVENPYDAYAAVRQTAPVVEAGPGFYVVTGRTETTTLLRDHDRFTSRKNLDGAFPFTPETQAVLEDSLFFRVALFNVEPPEHSAFRSLVSEAFTPRELRRREPGIRALAERLVRGFAADGHADLLTQFAYPLPMTVICDIIGVPAQDHAMVKAWNNAWLGLQVLPLEPEQQLASAKTVVEYESYFRNLIAERTRNPTDDLLSHLAAATREKEPVCTVDDVIVAMRVMLAAGHETTTNLIANTAANLLSERTLWEAVATDRGLIPAAVEEGLRFDSSVQGTPRFTTEDVRLGGVDIPAHCRVQAMIAAAGRDPGWVDDPDSFRLDRQGPPRHHAFGHGIHFCIGAPLARMEATIAFETLVEHLPDLAIAEGHQLSHQPGGFVFRGLTALPVTWTAPTGS